MMELIETTLLIGGASATAAGLFVLVLAPHIGLPVMLAGIFAAMAGNAIGAWRD